MFGLAMLVLIGVTVARMTGFEPLNAPVGGDVTAARSIDVRDGTNGALILEFPDTTAGFMLGAHRAYMFERKRTGGVVDMEAPVEVVRWADGRMSLIDPETGWRAELHNFGVTSQANFARVLEAQG
jgi:putative photosynthetic complex assembly protein